MEGDRVTLHGHVELRLNKKAKEVGRREGGPSGKEAALGLKHLPIDEGVISGAVVLDLIHADARHRSLRWPAD